MQAAVVWITAAGLSSAVGTSSASPRRRCRMPTPGGLSQTAVRHRRIHATLVLHIRQLKHICKLLCDWEFITVGVSIIRTGLMPAGRFMYAQGRPHAARHRRLAWALHTLTARAEAPPLAFLWPKGTVGQCPERGLRP